MKKVGRILGVVAAVAGLATLATGCGTNVIGADGPKPGIAADVDGSEITLDDLTSVVDGICTIQAADAQTPGTSRSYAQTQLLETWIDALIDRHYADDHDVTVSPQDPVLEKVPGWDKVDADDRDALIAYVDDVVYASAVKDELGKDETPDPADYDITINPKFDIRPDGYDAQQGGAAFTAAGGQLSVPVGDEAAAETTDAPSPDVVSALPDDQLCGARPAPAAPTSALPVPQQQ